MAWLDKLKIEDAASVAGTELFSDAVQPNAGEQVHVEVEADFPATPTDDLLVRLYATLDDTSENWDDTPVLEFAIDNGTDPNKVSFIVSGLYKWRLGFIRDGSTDTITVNAWIRRDGVSL
jgi:hypothetical protein